MGQQFALTEAGYTVVRLVQEVRGLEDRDGGEWVAKVALTAASARGVMVGVKG